MFFIFDIGKMSSNNTNNNIEEQISLLNTQIFVMALPFIKKTSAHILICMIRECEMDVDDNIILLLHKKLHVDIDELSEQINNILCSYEKEFPNNDVYISFETLENEINIVRPLITNNIRELLYWNCWLIDNFENIRDLCLNCTNTRETCMYTSSEYGKNICF